MLLLVSSFLTAWEWAHTLLKLSCPMRGTPGARGAGCWAVRRLVLPELRPHRRKATAQVAGSPPWVLLPQPRPRA